MRRSVAAFVGAVAIAFVAVSPAAQASIETTVLEVDLTGEVIPAHPCVEEDIVLSGSELLVDRFGFDESDGYHERLLSVSKGLSGTGVTTGTQYRVTGNEIWVLNAREDGFEFLLRVATNLISAGSGDNFLAFFHLKVTTDATGTPRAEFVRGSAGCRG